MEAKINDLEKENVELKQELWDEINNLKARQQVWEELKKEK